MARRSGSVSTRTHNGFTSLNQGGPAAHRESVRKARDAERILKRQAAAWVYHIQGHTMDEIAILTKVSGGQAWRDVMAHWELKREMSARDTEEVRAGIQAGLDRVKKMHWKKAGNATSAKVLLDVFRAEEQLHGAAKPRQGAVSMDQVMAAVRGTIRDLLAHFNEPTDRLTIGTAFARYFGPGAREQLAIDVGKKPNENDPSQSGE